MARTSCNTIALMFVIVLSLLGHQVFADSDSGCGNACNCPNKQSCTNGASKSSCCWSDATGCQKIDFLTDVNNCGSCGNACNTPTSFNRVCVNGQCQCGGVGQPCCSDYAPNFGYGNGCKGTSGLSSGCPTQRVGCASNSCTCQCVDSGSFPGFLPDSRPNPQCP